MVAELAHWTKRVIAAVGIVGALAYVPYRIYGSEGVVRYRTLDRQSQELDGRNAALTRENQLLRTEIRRLRNDLDAIATVARDELGMVAPGEMVLQLRPRGGGDGSLAPGTP